MADIFDILKGAEIEIPEDKRESVNTELRKTYKHIDEVSKINEQLKSAQESLKAGNAEIERFKSLDIDGVQKAAAEWEEKYNKSQEESAAKIADMEYCSALKEALSSEKFSSIYAREGVISEIRNKKLPLEGGQIMGLADAIKAIRESQPDAFALEVAKDLNLRGAGMGNGGKPPATPTEKDAAIAAAQKAMNLKIPKG